MAVTSFTQFIQQLLYMYLTKVCRIAQHMNIQQLSNIAASKVIIFFSEWIPDVCTLLSYHCPFISCCPCSSNCSYQVSQLPRRRHDWALTWELLLIQRKWSFFCTTIDDNVLNSWLLQWIFCLFYHTLNPSWWILSKPGWSTSVLPLTYPLSLWRQLMLGQLTVVFSNTCPSRNIS